MRESASSTRQPGDDPVDRLHPQRVGGRVDEHRQAEVPSAGAVTRGPVLRLQLAVGGVAVVAVGDQRLPVVEVARHPGLDGRVGDRPQPLQEAVLAAGLQQRPARADLVEDAAVSPPPS